MYDRPTKMQLLSAVRDFLENVAMPELEGHTAFHARVAVNALAIVLRELELGPATDAAETERLRALGCEGSLAEQNRELCRRLRAGEMTLDTPGLAAHLHETTLAKLAVDQPRYAGYRRALERRGSP